MRAGVGVIALLAARIASADVTAPVQAPGWAARCGDRLRARMAAIGGALGREFSSGRVVSTAGRSEYRVGDPRGEEMVAVLMRAGNTSSSAWERDDQWNYPIEETLVWRERREVPDFEAQVAVFRDARGKGPSAARRVAFVAAARAGLDQCLSDASRWRAPAGALHWELSGSMYVEEFSVWPTGAASIAHHTDGGTVGAMASASAEDVDPVIEKLRANGFCALPVRPQGSNERLETIRLELPSGKNQIGSVCSISMGEGAWRADPRAAACRAAVIELRDKLFRGRELTRPDQQQ
jgi:hypothetical protein